MAKYTVGKNWFFPELGRKPELGEVITIPGDLTEEQAKKYFDEKGLLASVRQTAQGHPQAIRTPEEEPKEDEKPAVETPEEPKQDAAHRFFRKRKR